MLTGIPLRERPEVRENETAHKEFLRLKKLLEKIDKFDDMYGAVINRYCILYAETKEFEEKKERFYRQLCDLEENKEELLETEQMTYGEFYKTEMSMQKNLIALDRQVQAKRRMLSDIEKENIMTIASSLRSVPKTEAKKSNPLKEALGG
ncbi:MAG: P27 family phage terminase small subunit [Lachnospiraceae bacterium]|nr:P27 family phage terminase small subunit [Lachnospiraceae bacterium]